MEPLNQIEKEKEFKRLKKKFESNDWHKKPDLIFSRFKQLQEKCFANSRIKIQLLKENFSEESIEKILAETPLNETQRAVVFLKKRYKHGDDKKAIGKAFRALCRLGFEYQTVKKVVLRHFEHIKFS